MAPVTSLSDNGDVQRTAVIRTITAITRRVSSAYWNALQFTLAALAVAVRTSTSGSQPWSLASLSSDANEQLGDRSRDTDRLV